MRRLDPTAPDHVPRWPQADETDPFLTAEWFDVLAKEGLVPGSRPCYLSAGEPSSRLVLPLRESRVDVFPHGSMLEGLANYYSPIFDAVGTRTTDSMQELSRRLEIAARSHDVLRLTPLEDGGALAGMVRTAFDTPRWATRSVPAFGNWYFPCEGMRFSDYLDRVESSFPATCEKRRQQFLRKNIGRLAVIDSSDGLDAALDAYAEVYARSWKRPEPNSGFVPSLARLAARKGWLRLGIAHVGEQPVAAQLWLVAHRRAMIFKVAYDERFSKQSVGSILSAHMFAHVLDSDRVGEIDYLSGDDEYKRKWMSHRRVRTTFIATNLWRIRGVATAARHWLGARRGRSTDSTRTSGGSAHDRSPTSSGTAPS